MRKFKMILAVIIVAVLAISCNNPSSLAKDFESALKKKDFEKAAKVIEKAAEKYPSWSSKEQTEFFLAVVETHDQFREHSSSETYEMYNEVLDGPWRKLLNADDVWGDYDDDEDEDEDDEW